MIEVQDLKYAYPKAGRPAVDGLAFDVQAGEIFGMLGPSGAGKSTTQKILIGLLRGYGGRVSVLGREVARWGPDYYGQIGVGFELPSHFLKLTARENLTYFRALYQGQTERPETVLDWVDLGADADKRVAEFSKGMKNRLTVARALLHRPKLLFLDEPTSGLDPVNSRLIQELIRRKRDEGATVVLTTHQMQLAETLCDRVAFLLDGRIRLVDTPRALKLRYGKRQVQVEYGGDGALQTVSYPLEGLGNNPAFVELLRRVPVETIHTQETTLEEIFVRVTGDWVTGDR